ncbi:Saccharopine dehydrogenase [NADP, L-glutamate-forming], partial [hydrothermal vent metagenome]
MYIDICMNDLNLASKLQEYFKMRKILIIGAGRSASSLVKYLLDKSSKEKLQIIIADINLFNCKKLAQNHPNSKVLELDIFNSKERKNAIQDADIVISMLPARFHINVAKDCVLFAKSLVTASYISDELKALDKEVRSKGLVFMNEIGLD